MVTFMIGAHSDQTLIGFEYLFVTQLDDLKLSTYESQQGKWMKVPRFSPADNVTE